MCDEISIYGGLLWNEVRYVEGRGGEGDEDWRGKRGKSNWREGNGSQSVT